MKAKIILLSLISFIVLLLFSASLIYLQMSSLKGLHLEVLEDKLHDENTGILSWAMKNVNPENLGQTALPPSWGEILVVDNASLTINSSTGKEHVGKSLITIPALLDQSAPVIDAIKKARAATVKTKDYMIALSPLDQGRTLIGFKPRSWERGLLSEQNSKIQQRSGTALNTLIFYLAAGLIFSVIISLILAFLIMKPAADAAKEFERLSLGDFDAEIPRSGGKIMVSLSDSFFRLKTSLKYALEKIGSK